ncbi:O-antigen ligase family protein [Candidatus Daviesbacteria bacterium]|nr:O-antigen ligase family protein [Candidatus Daviesbacteria bacterium]
MLNKIIPYSFYLLFFLTPLFWSSLNYELFEYNKMILVYAFTVIIVGAWLLKTISDKQSLRPDGLKRLTIKRTPLDIPLLLFLGANILSAIFSMDPHTSIWGYYSRSNGGLLSLVSYLLLYWAFVSNMDFAKVKTTLKFGLAAGFIISLWAIFEHFGVSPSCIILREEFNADCWIQDVQARVFATLGQPNWLAAYLAMLIFPAMYFFLTSTKKLTLTTYYLLLTTYYLAFTFTYSRGPTLGLIGGMTVFILLSVFSGRLSELSLSVFGLPVTDKQKTGKLISENRQPRTDNWRLLGYILVSFIIINLLFGSALTSFRLVSKFAAPVRPGISIPIAPSGTQLENGGTESGQIRFIVWRGAWEIFKHNPILGSGLETFAYSYYQYRPVEHNLTSEWDFLYNKAHNEYLNYLATTGIVGLGALSIIIITFITFILRKRGTESLLLYSLLAAYISYLIYNFFLFSVVIIAVFFYLFPALAFIATDSLKISNFKLRILKYTKTSQAIVIFLMIYLLYSVFQLWYADTLFAKGQKATSAGNTGRAYNLLSAAAQLNTGEPFYKSELGFAAAQAAVALEDSDATLSAGLKDEAVAQTKEALKISPKNVSFLRTAVRTYFELSMPDKTLETLDAAIKLAPTDPKLYYNKALVLDSLDQKKEEIKILQQAINLKPNYLEAIEQLKEAK